MDSVPPVSRGDQKAQPRVTIPAYADVAQLAERNLAKVEVAGSIPVVRSSEGGRFDRPHR